MCASPVSTLPRRWEDKFDAKSFKSSSVTIRLVPPSGKRKVPLCFDAWVVMPDAGMDDHPFSNCQLLQDRH